MNALTLLSRIIQSYARRLGLTYFLFILEVSGSLLRPFFLGIAVNDLIHDSYRGLLLLGISHLLWLVIGSIRQMYDTRTYADLYTSLVTGFLFRKRKHQDVSRLCARASLSRELVDFLEADVPYIAEAFFNILGSAILLFYYDASVAFICLAVLFPVGIISRYYGKKMLLLSAEKNDELEKQVSVIAMGNKERIRDHFSALRRLQIRISDKEALSFGLIELLVLVVISLSLFVSSGKITGGLEAGTLLAIYNYVLKFVSGLDSIPYALQRVALLSDITARIQESAVDQTTPSIILLENESDRRLTA
ncbi:MAG: ABC transporter six-transmembrane domain-containing protein [Ferruginibacter sp.]